MLDGILQQMDRHQLHGGFVHQSSQPSLWCLYTDVNTFVQQGAQLLNIAVHLCHYVGLFTVEEQAVLLDIHDRRQLIHEVRQLMAVLIDQLGHMHALLFRHLATFLDQQIGEAHDGVQRRAQGVTDIPQEHILQLFIPLYSGHLPLQALAVDKLLDKHNHQTEDNDTSQQYPDPHWNMGSVER